MKMLYITATRSMIESNYMEFEFILPKEARLIVDKIDSRKLNIFEFLIEKKILPEIDAEMNHFFDFYSTPREIIQRREIYLKMLDFIKKRKKSAVY